MRCTRASSLNKTSESVSTAVSKTGKPLGDSPAGMGSAMMKFVGDPRFDDSDDKPCRCPQRLQALDTEIEETRCDNQ
jgi:hypothetical protein